MKPRIVIALIVCLVCLPLLACSEAQIARAQKVGRVCATAHSEANRLIPQLIEQGNLSIEEGERLQQGLDDLGKVVAEYNTFVTTLTPKDKTALVRVATLAGQLADSLERLHKEGVLKIKNPRTRARIDKILLAAQTITGALVTALAEAGYTPERGHA